MGILFDLTPPLLQRLVRRVRGKPSRHIYQGVNTPFDMSALHHGRFASIYDAAYPNDPQLVGNGNVLRLRAYQAYLFAEIAMRARGDYLAAGVSYGVIPKVLYELSLRGSGRTFHLIDPLVDQERVGYCNDPALVSKLLDGDPAVRLQLGAIPAVFPLALPDGLAFAHLNTGDEEAELASLPYLVDHLNPGGVIVLDEYASQQAASRYDAAATHLGASVFTLPTGQGVLVKNLADNGWVRCVSARST